MNHASILRQSHFPSVTAGGIRRRVAALGAHTSVEIHRRARASRASAIARSVVASLRSVRRALRRALARYRQHRAAVETMRALRALDDRTLHDLGYDRSQIQSVAIELSRVR
jgi:uncharacterized protein YjiS (DUF1127 family)